MTRPRFLIAGLALALGVSSCARIPAPEFRPGLASPDAGWVRRTLRAMTLEEKVGQMIACRFTGTFRNADSEYLANMASLITKTRIGGLILFGGEVYETAELTNAFQKLAKVPLLFASDFERGTGNQITNATLFPPLMALGAAGSEDLAYQMGRITAVEGSGQSVVVSARAAPRKGRDVKKLRAGRNAHQARDDHNPQTKANVTDKKLVC